MVGELGPLEPMAFKLVVAVVVEEVVGVEADASSSDLLFFLAAAGELEAAVETFGVGVGACRLGEVVFVVGLNGEEFINVKSSAL